MQYCDSDSDEVEFETRVPEVSAEALPMHSDFCLSDIWLPSELLLNRNEAFDYLSSKPVIFRTLEKFEVDEKFSVYCDESSKVDEAEISLDIFMSEICSNVSQNDEKDVPKGEFTTQSDYLSTPTTYGKEDILSDEFMTENEDFASPTVYEDFLPLQRNKSFSNLFHGQLPNYSADKFSRDSLYSFKEASPVEDEKDKSLCRLIKLTDTRRFFEIPGNAKSSVNLNDSLEELYSTDEEHGIWFKHEECRIGYKNKDVSSFACSNKEELYDQARDNELAASQSNLNVTEAEYSNEVFSEFKNKDEPSDQESDGEMTASLSYLNLKKTKYCKDFSENGPAFKNKDDGAFTNKNDVALTNKDDGSFMGKAIDERYDQEHCSELAENLSYMNEEETEHSEEVFQSAYPKVENYHALKNKDDGSFTCKAIDERRDQEHCSELAENLLYMNEEKTEHHEEVFQSAYPKVENYRALTNKDDGSFTCKVIDERRDQEHCSELAENLSYMNEEKTEHCEEVFQSAYPKVENYRALTNKDDGSFTCKAIDERRDQEHCSELPDNLSYMNEEETEHREEETEHREEETEHPEEETEHPEEETEHPEEVSQGAYPKVEKYNKVYRKTDLKDEPTKQRTQKVKKKKKSQKKNLLPDLLRKVEELDANERPESHEYYESLVRRGICKPLSAFQTPSEIPISNENSMEKFPCVHESNYFEQGADSYASWSIATEDLINDFKLSDPGKETCTLGQSGCDLEQSHATVMIENIPCTVSREAVRSMIVEYGELKSLVLIPDGKFLKAQVEMHAACDIEWIIDGLNGNQPFGAACTEVLKIYKI